MSHIRKNIQSATQYETTLEMDDYLKQNEERIRKMVLREKIITLVNNPNYSEIILQNQQNGVLYTQNVMRNMTETNEIYKKLNRKTNTQPQTI
jgi:hypothetical protein